MSNARAQILKILSLISCLADHVKEFIVGLVDKLQKTFPYLEDSVKSRLHKDSVENLFEKNPVCFFFRKVFGIFKSF